MRSGVTGHRPISGDHCAALAPVRDNVSAVVTPPPPPPRLGHLDNGALALITGTLWHWQQSSPVNTPSHGIMGTGIPDGGLLRYRK